MTRVFRILCILFMLSVISMLMLPAPVKGQGVSVVTKNQMQLRAGPSTKYAALAVIPAQTTLPVIARDKTNKWLQVNFNNTIGWVLIAMTTVTGDINSLPVVDVPPPPTPINKARVKAATAKICDTNAAVAGAPGYDGSPGLHPITILSVKGAKPPLRVRAGALGKGDAQLAACIGTREEAVIEDCLYGSTGDHHLQRIQYFREVRVMIVSTAQVIGTTKLAGAAPETCQPVESFIIGKLTKTKKGKDVSAQQVLDYITPFAQK